MLAYTHGGAPVNDEYFLARKPTRPHDRDLWDAFMSLALELDIIATKMFETEQACRIAERPRAPSPKPRPRSTPETTVDAVWYCVRERGVAALREPANQRRLHTFDEDARRELNKLIATLSKEQPRAA